MEFGCTWTRLGEAELWYPKNTNTYWPESIGKNDGYFINLVLRQIFGLLDECFESRLILYFHSFRADSVTWNPHKMLTAPQQCSTFLTKHERVLTESNSSCASYLFQKDKFYDTTYDTGDKHIQCGRRADVFKFWFMWKAKVRSNSS